jgi:hypothetical protein
MQLLAAGVMASDEIEGCSPKSRRTTSHHSLVKIVVQE